MILDLSRRSIRFLGTLDLKRFRQVMWKVLSLLTEPIPNDAQRLSGHVDVWRADIGEFRIAYRIEDDVLRVIVIGRRNDDAVYKELDRLPQ